MTDAPDGTDVREARLPGRRLLVAGLVAFVVAGLAFFVAGPLLSPDVEPQRGYAVAERAQPAPGGTFQVTLDVSDRDHWIPFDFGAGRLVPTIEEADLGVRRYVLRAPAGALDLGEVTLEEARLPSDPQWIADEESGGALQNPALSGWYEYSYWTHVLRTTGHTFAVRRRNGQAAFLRLESYYCLPEGSGCLTFRYRLE